MKKTILFPVFFSLFLSVYAQNAAPLIRAEEEFQKTCLQKGIRDGFLAFVDSNAVAMIKKGAENAMQFWKSLPVFDGVFTWSPSYAEMSITGDWGYTTGNYEHRPKTITDSVSEYGQYSTVWHRTPGGEWKYLFDIGNVHPIAMLTKKSQIVSVKKYSSGSLTPDALPDNPEKEFVLAFGINISDAYKKYAGNRYILNLTGHQAIRSPDSAVVLLNKMSPSLQFHSSGMFISPGRDMLAVYGILGQENSEGSYLRIWRHEKAGWKIALEVIRN